MGLPSPLRILVARSELMPTINLPPKDLANFKTLMCPGWRTSKIPLVNTTFLSAPLPENFSTRGTCRPSPNDWFNQVLVISKFNSDEFIHAPKQRTLALLCSRLLTAVSKLWTKEALTLENLL